MSDTERSEVADALSEHFAHGRLDHAELDERAARAMSARTRADLAELLDDLPQLRRWEPSPNTATSVGAPAVGAPRGRRREDLLIVAAAAAFVMMASSWWAWRWWRPQSISLIVLIASVGLLVRHALLAR